MAWRSAAFVLAISALSWNVLAHDLAQHAVPAPESASLIEESSALTAGADDFPVNVGGEFELIDQYGKPRSSADYQGEHLLVFFGYLSCPFMCSQTLRSMAAALDTLGDKAERLNAVMITVDPENDTPEHLSAKMPKIHPRMMGLTGSAEQLERAYDAFRIEPKAVEAEWNGTAVISHASYIYLMGPDGRFRTLMPPILPPDTMAEIIGRYLESKADAEAKEVMENSG